MRFGGTRNRHYAPFGRRPYLSQFANPIAISVVPERNPAQFGSSQYAILIVVQGM